MDNSSSRQSGKTHKAPHLPADGGQVDEHAQALTGQSDTARPKSASGATPLAAGNVPMPEHTQVLREQPQAARPNRANNAGPARTEDADNATAFEDESRRARVGNAHGAKAHAHDSEGARSENADSARARDDSECARPENADSARARDDSECARAQNADSARARDDSECARAENADSARARDSECARAQSANSAQGVADDSDVVVLPIEDAIDLHGFIPRDIPSVVDEYLWAASQHGFGEVRLIHGRGKGVQRAIVQELLKKHALVETFSDAPAYRGGWGATVVWLKTKNSR